MATDTVSNGPDETGLPAAFIEARERVCYDAASEICAISGMLRREIGAADDYDYLTMLRGALLRVEALSCTLVTLQGSSRDNEQEIAESYQLLFGQKLEVSHG